MLNSVLVANRGEIARRVFATCRRMGLGCVAVFSDPDADSPHVAEADVAVRLPGAAPAETYLRADLLVAAARAAGADAVHPGYGFLAENADFARAVLAADLTWVGPPVTAIELMGSKVDARRLVRRVGVPVLAALDQPTAVTGADLPVVIKASAGGGGRGMRVVHDLAGLPAQWEAARREARSAFGDPTVFCERYVPAGHHVEVQVLADRHGTVWTVGERECSIQRRHQKILEEAPSPLVERVPGLRERLFEAARLAATAVGYQGAGTVEFLVDPDGDFFFLEMNTRLQVEHPVTECTTGLDLVRLQFQVAEGFRLPVEPPARRGHAIEARLYAEDPARDWRPRSGILHRLAVPAASTAFAVGATPGVRVDSGVADGSRVGVHYDPMLAKVIAHGADRAEAARLLASALAGARIHGLVTNRDLLVRVLRHPAFLAGDTDTAFLTTHGLTALARPLASPEAVALSAVAAALADAAGNQRRSPVNPHVPSGWRNLPSVPQHKTFGVVTAPVPDSPAPDIEVRYRFTRTGLRVDGHDGLALVSATPDLVVLDVPGGAGPPLRHRFTVAGHHDLVWVDSTLGPVTLTRRPRFAAPTTAAAAGSLLAPMPGTVIRVTARAGDRVTAGQPLVYLEAMKMEHPVTVPTTGVLTELAVTVGQSVTVDTVLAVVTPDSTHDTHTPDDTETIVPTGPPTGPPPEERR